MSTPADRKYASSHEWVKIEGNTAVIGITDFAQSELGDVTYVEVPEVGRQVIQGGDAAVIESVKAAADIYAPLSGTVAAVNSQLEETPELINQDPYEAGWIFKLSGFDVSELDNLLSAQQYEDGLE